MLEQKGCWRIRGHLQILSFMDLLFNTLMGVPCNKRNICRNTRFSKPTTFSESFLVALGSASESVLDSHGRAVTREEQLHAGPATGHRRGYSQSTRLHRRKYKPVRLVKKTSNIETLKSTIPKHIGVATGDILTVINVSILCVRC